ncbi:MAG: hypothetical protein DWQ31_07815 [Planctomycetota bacterium]|nr:MAG: hypothetical protein DWQ31_07815 [Planctomycetota bacterium]REJ96100.1 MAG: hypothetical protein DWQ35_05165 [Planctomycetota bacterium]REK21872.1 MAG: hypothetical protein DWQ42_18495 [Planctomycetota bacterium]REK46680.1 MAG: hypothetical protein DWQ46_06180 [Planctomycetota bacterium]
MAKVRVLYQEATIVAARTKNLHAWKLAPRTLRATMTSSSSHDESPSALPVVRRFLTATLAAGVVVAIVVTVIYRQDLASQQQLLEGAARRVLDLQSESLLLELSAVESDLRFLAGQETLERFVSGESESQASVEREFANFAVEKGVYDQIRVLDLEGQEVIRVNYRQGEAEVVPRDDLQAKANRDYFQAALRLADEEIYVSPFDLNVERGKLERPIKPVIRFLAPVLDRGGARQGFLVLNFLGARLLAELQQLAGGFRGETMLVSAAGEYLSAADPTREWGWLIGHQRRFASDFPAAWEASQAAPPGDPAAEPEILRVAGDLFAMRRVALGHPVRETSSPSDNAQHDDNSLLLIAYVSAADATAPSGGLLRQLVLLSLCLLVVVALLAFYWARTSVARERQERQIADSEARLRRLSSQLLAAQEDERRNLSRDLHDDLGQLATAISLDLRSLQKSSAELAENELLQRALTETDGLLRSMHEIARQVRPRVLDDLGLRDAVESLLDEYEQRTGIRVVADLQMGETSISRVIGESVFRIVQEALANVAKHAQADEAEVVLATREGELQLRVRDRGRGFDPQSQVATGRLGILGMRERVELLGGRFTLESAAAAGTTIDVVIPLN